MLRSPANAGAKDDGDALQHKRDRGLSLSLMRESGIAPIVRGEVIE
jgi:hypothetical protein